MPIIRAIIKPKAIIQVYETGTYAKAFEIVSKKLGIKSIAIQHGLIPTDFPEYICKEIQNENFPLGNFIPDKTLVYGNYYKKILTEIGQYPKDKVEVIGHPTYFDFEKMKNLLNKQEIMEKNNLDNKKIILFPLSMRFFYIKNSPDNRSYFASSKKIEDTLHFQTKYNVADASKEMFSSLENNTLDYGEKTITIKWYEHIKNDESLLRKHSINGKFL